MILSQADADLKADSTTWILDKLLSPSELNTRIMLHSSKHAIDSTRLSHTAKAGKGAAEAQHSPLSQLSHPSGARQPSKKGQS